MQGLSDAGGTQLYITAGLSTTGSAPLMFFRFLNRPQISIIELTADVAAKHAGAIASPRGCPLWVATFFLPMRGHTTARMPTGGERMADMPHADLLRSVLTGALETDMENFKAIFGLPENATSSSAPSTQAVFPLRHLHGGHGTGHQVADFILRACHAFDAGAGQAAPDARAGFLLKNAVCIPQARLENRMQELTAQILGGMTALLIDGCKDGY